jgi:hypothetical protein
MRIDDRLLAVSGGLVAAMGRRAEWAPRFVIVGLAILSLVPVLLVGSSPEPSEISFEDLHAGRVPPRTSWLRLTGELRTARRDVSYTFSYPYTYILDDTGGSGLAVTVVAESPLVAGQTEITGVIAGAVSYPGTFASIEADVPTKPGRKDPWLLYSLPAIAAVVMIVGLRAGYPVTRVDERPRSRPLPLAHGAPVPAQWSGRIEGQLVPLDRMLPCTLAVTGERDVETCELIVNEGDSIRILTIRRASPKRYLRMCQVRGCVQALEVHAPACDLILAFARSTDRDRIAVLLE